MNSCKECMHRLVCEIYAPNFNDILANGENCSEFKDEANFVEVIRCKDCKWWIDDRCINVNGAYGNIILNPNWFCSSGYRKN